RQPAEAHRTSPGTAHPESRCAVRRPEPRSMGAAPTAASPAGPRGPNSTTRGTTSGTGGSRTAVAASSHSPRPWACGTGNDLRPPRPRRLRRLHLHRRRHGRRRRHPLHPAGPWKGAPVSRSKDIGTRAETAVAKYLRANGFEHAERRALRGAADAGDITGTPGICWEVKARKRPISDTDVAAWLAETETEAAAADAEIGVLVVRRPGVGEAHAGRWWAYMRLG